MKQDIEIIIEKGNWRFIFTYIDTHPHEYVVREKCTDPNDFDIISQYVKDNGHQEYFFEHPGIYCSIGNYTYWVMGNIINRRWNDMYYVTSDNHIEKVDNWKELLKDGRVPPKK